MLRKDGRKDGSVTISLRNFVGEGIIKALLTTTIKALNKTKIKALLTTTIMALLTTTIKALNKTNITLYPVANALATPNSWFYKKIVHLLPVKQNTYLHSIIFFLKKFTIRRGQQILLILFGIKSIRKIIKTEAKSKPLTQIYLIAYSPELAQALQ
jgi:hypothetical protein